MAIHIIRADLSDLPVYVDFIVNTANPEPKVGKGLDKAIFDKAGPEMLEDRKRIGHIAPGDIAITNAYGLNAKKVIHAVSVAWTDGFHDEAVCVQKCYRKALAAAADYMHNHNEPSLINLNLDTLNRGLAEAEGNPTYVPLDKQSQSMYNGLIPTSSNGSSAWANVVMQPGPEMAYGNQNLHMVENLPMVHSKGSINPYADYLASLQQADAAETGTVLGTGLQREIAGVPNSMHTEIQCCTPVQMANMAGIAVPSFLSGMNGLSPKKKGVKATAYDLMSDFIVRIPMFTHEQDVYIYDNQKGYYKRTPQHEVEQMIMDLYRPIIREYGSGTLIEKVYKLLLKEPYIVRNNVPVSDPTKISFANCTVDIQNQTMGPHSPGNIVTHSLNCDLARFNHTKLPACTNAVMRIIL